MLDLKYEQLVSRITLDDGLQKNIWSCSISENLEKLSAGFKAMNCCLKIDSALPHFIIQKWMVRTTTLITLQDLQPG